jgi:hypothetical protein
MPYNTLQLEEREESRFDPQGFYTATASDIVGLILKSTPLPFGQSFAINTLWTGFFRNTAICSYPKK